jgi:hypothetical protein
MKLNTKGNFENTFCDNVDFIYYISNFTLPALAIDSLPAPFNNLFDIVWNGLEKDDDSLLKLLKILERIENTDHESFFSISLKVSELMQSGAKVEDAFGPDITDR